MNPASVDAAMIHNKLMMLARERMQCEPLAPSPFRIPVLASPVLSKFLSPLFPRIDGRAVTNPALCVYWFHIYIFEHHLETACTNAFVIDEVLSVITGDDVGTFRKWSDVHVIVKEQRTPLPRPLTEFEEQQLEFAFRYLQANMELVRDGRKFKAQLSPEQIHQLNCAQAAHRFRGPETWVNITERREENPAAAAARL